MSKLAIEGKVNPQPSIGDSTNYNPCALFYLFGHTSSLQTFRALHSTNKKIDLILHFEQNTRRPIYYGMWCDQQ